MKCGVVFLLIACVCCDDVKVSDEGSKFQKEIADDFPGTNIAEVINNINSNTTTDSNKTSVFTDDLFKSTNLSGTPDTVTNITTNNANGSVLETIENTDLADAPHTERGGSRRLGSSRYKSGRQQVSISDLTLSGDVPRHGALMHKTPQKFDTVHVQTGDKVDADVDPEISSDTGENTFKRKRRIPVSSTTPSVQIAILVIGAVVGCVLLTGFIRWRVRGRLNANKQKNMLDDFIIYHDKTTHQGDSEMDTIFECECEEGQGLLHSHDSLEPGIALEDGSKFDEMSCSHRFDAPLSLMSHTYSAGNNSRLQRPKSPKSGRDLELIRGTKRQATNRRKYGYKGRYYRHQKRRLENMFVQTLETIPMENTVTAHDEYRGMSCATSLWELDDKNAHHQSTSSQPPLLLRRSSPPARRSALATLLNTWRSLSFNRDWVGKMWQEQHNIRRISDLLRRMTPSRDRDSDSDSSRPVSIISDRDIATDVERHSISEEVQLSTGRQRSAVVRGTDNACVLSCVNETDSNLNAGIALREESTAIVDLQTVHSSVVDDNAGLASGGIRLDNSNDVTVDSSTSIQVANCGQLSRPGHFRRFWSFSNHQDEPPEYASLLDNEGQQRSAASRSGIEQGRYPRRHRKRRLEDRERTSRLFSSNVCSATDSDDTDTESTLTRVRGDSLAFTHNHRRQSQPVVANSEPQVSDITDCQPDRSQVEEQETSLNTFPNPPSDVRASTTAPPFVAQMVIEQLSDGAQIVYIPPPALPSYHNDTPPPYQQ